MTMILDEPATEADVKARRAELGIDLFDEVWDGVTIVSPGPNNQHQMLSSAFQFVLYGLIAEPGAGTVCATVNVSDRDDDWMTNFRVPDLAVFLNGNGAIDRETHWVGGPDFAVELLSPRDRARQKLDFYAKIGVRELLIVDRDPWGVELYRLDSDKLAMVGRITVGDEKSLQSEVLPLSFRLIPGAARPTIQATHIDGNRHWSI